MNNPTISRLVNLVKSRGGILLSKEAGGMVACDSMGRYPATINLANLSDSETERAIDQLSELLELADNEGPNSGNPTFEIHTTVEAIHQSSSIRASLRPILESLGPGSTVELRLYFTKPPENWYYLANWLALLLGMFPQLHGKIYLWGPFDLNDQLWKQTFWDLGAKLGAVAGWLPTGNQELEQNVLSDLANFGFRVPVIYFVSKENAANARSVIETGLVANQHAGFALPSVFHHPDYILEDQASTPDSESYAKLIAELYKDLPHFDEVFFPVQEVISSFASGAWLGETPKVSRIILKPDKGIGFFRQIPTLATGWVEWDSFNQWELTETRGKFSDIQKSEFFLSKAKLCRECPWWQMCGGVDAKGQGLVVEKIREAACEYRKGLLEGLVHFRAQSIPLQLPVSGPVVNLGEMGGKV